MGVSPRRYLVRVAAAICALSLTVGSAFAGSVPSAEVSFSVEGQEFFGGQAVTMSGRIQPATVREVVRLETQVRRNDKWRAYDIKKTKTTRKGRFSYTHDAFPAGKKYRTRLLWDETVDHLGGKTVWDAFKVQRRHF